MPTHIIVQGRHIKPGDEYSGRVVSVEVLPSGLVALKAIDGDFTSPVFYINPDIHFQKWRTAVIYWSEYGEFVFSADSIESRDTDAFMRNHYAARGTRIAVGWGETKGDVAVVTFEPTLFDGEAITPDRRARAPDLIDSVIPGFAKHCRSYIDARRDLLREIRPLDSIGDLEKQVDMLSALVFSLIRFAPPEAVPPWFLPFQQAVEESASTAFKTSMENIAEISKSKRHIRSTQEQYFSNKV